MSERTDTERLDWLEANEADVECWGTDQWRVLAIAIHEAEGTTLREAIDTAMDATTEEQAGEENENG